LWIIWWSFCAVSRHRSDFRMDTVYFHFDFVVRGWLLRNEIRQLLLLISIDDRYEQQEPLGLIVAKTFSTEDSVKSNVAVLKAERVYSTRDTKVARSFPPLSAMTGLLKEYSSSELNTSIQATVRTTLLKLSERSFFTVLQIEGTGTFHERVIRK
jgi:hypothetical protein